MNFWDVVFACAVGVVLGQVAIFVLAIIVRTLWTLLFEGFRLDRNPFYNRPWR